MTGPPAPLARRNLIAFVCGRKGSGKSTLLYRRFTRHFPRVLTLDVTGEATDFNPHVVQVAGLPELRKALAWCVRQGPRWHVAAALEDDELPQLLELLAPPFASGRVGFARAVGGLALECGEIDETVPNRGADPDLLASFKRGRHSLLSWLAGTQRPAECARVVTSQADWICIVGALDEPTERAWVATTISRPIADLVADLPKHYAVMYCRTDQKVYVCDPTGRVVRRLDRALSSV